MCVYRSASHWVYYRNAVGLLMVPNWFIIHNKCTHFMTIMPRAIYIPSAFMNMEDALINYWSDALQYLCCLVSILQRGTFIWKAPGDETMPPLKLSWQQLLIPASEASRGDVVTCVWLWQTVRGPITVSSRGIISNAWYKLVEKKWTLYLGMWSDVDSWRETGAD